MLWVYSDNVIDHMYFILSNTLNVNVILDHTKICIKP